LRRQHGASVDAELEHAEPHSESGGGRRLVSNHFQGVLEEVGNFVLFALARRTSKKPLVRWRQRAVRA
jgi:hypothetical protein